MTTSTSSSSPTRRRGTGTSFKRRVLLEAPVRAAIAGRCPSVVPAARFFDPSLQNSSPLNSTISTEQKQKTTKTQRKRKCTTFGLAKICNNTQLTIYIQELCGISTAPLKSKPSSTPFYTVPAQVVLCRTPHSPSSYSGGTSIRCYMERVKRN